MKVKSCATKRTKVYTKELSYKGMIKHLSRFTSSLYFTLILLLSALNLFSQNTIPADIFESKGGIEVHLPAQLYTPSLTQHPGITLDHGCSKDIVHLYLTEDGYTHMLGTRLPFEYIPQPKVNIRMMGPTEIAQARGKSLCMPDIDYYPTYEAYDSLMQAFAEAHPSLCQIINIGTLESGRQLLAAHIGDPNIEKEKKPNILLTASMHGDETAGYILSLQLIDYLLCHYDNDAQIKELIDNTHIYINPLANPDGIYQDDNSTIEGARRRNSNNVDLNRNYPDPKVGPNPDNRPTQQETQYFLDFADSYDIDLSINMHGGAELANYPWDTFEQLSADDSWWVQTCRAYADDVHSDSPDPNYFREEDNGITNGFQWYEVAGSRQDYMVYYKRAREFTLELSQRKTVDSEDLPAIWNANKNALINYMKTAVIGLRGTIIDCNSGLPLSAEIYIPDHDIDNSSVFSDSTLGYYVRYLDDGIYNVQVLASGYDTLFQTIEIIDGEALVWDIELCPVLMSAAEESFEKDISIVVGDDQVEVKGLSAMDVEQLVIYNSSGQAVQAAGYSLEVSVEHLPSGYYVAQIKTKKRYYVKSFFIE